MVRIKFIPDINLWAHTKHKSRPVKYLKITQQLHLDIWIEVLIGANEFWPRMPKCYIDASYIWCQCIKPVMCLSMWSSQQGIHHNTVATLTRTWKAHGPISMVCHLLEEYPCDMHSAGSTNISPWFWHLSREKTRIYVLPDQATSSLLTRSPRREFASCWMTYVLRRLGSRLRKRIRMSVLHYRCNIYRVEQFVFLTTREKGLPFTRQKQAFCPDSAMHLLRCRICLQQQDLYKQ